MNKISAPQVGQMLKLAAENLRALSEENQNLKVKVAHFEKKERAEQIATVMEEKGLEPELDFKDKVAGLMKRDDLRVVEEAVGMSAPQMKLASVHEDSRVVVEGGMSDAPSDAPALAFAANLASI